MLCYAMAYTYTMARHQHSVVCGLHLVTDEKGTVVRTLDQQSALLVFPEVNVNFWLQKDGKNYKLAYQKTLKSDSEFYISYESNMEVYRKKADLIQRLNTLKQKQNLTLQIQRQLNLL